jgi:hypothetical protein
VSGRVRRAGRALRDFLAVQVELHERMALRDRPWEEELLHWSADGRLHGSIPPPRGRRGVTRGGWCTGLAAEVTESSPLPRSGARA